ncbi:MAG: MBL fold metallo-hydrolase, partial [Clostridia bacterium]|nr:MBL fold metallo-hydrolase [Clostridia bacterium]
MLTYISFASSSDGNAGLVTDGTTHLLLDAGISAKRITASLKSLGLEAGALQGVLLTHFHSDHTKGLENLLKKTPLPVYSPGKGFKALRPFMIGGITITAFHTPHDAYPSCGFRFEAGEDTLGFATDLGHVTEEVEATLKGVRRLVIESNYDRDMLMNGPYPYSLKVRIDSPSGHLSNEDCGVFLARMADNGLE